MNTNLKEGLSAATLAGVYAHFRDEWRELELRKKSGEDVEDEIDRARSGMFKVKSELNKFSRV